MHISVPCLSHAADSHTVQGTYAKVKYGQHVQTGEVVAIKVKKCPSSDTMAVHLLVTSHGCPEWHRLWHESAGTVVCVRALDQEVLPSHLASLHCADSGQGEAVEGGYDGPDQAGDHHHERLA